MHIFKEMRMLRDEGKLHTRLLIRLRIMFTIAAVLAGIVLYNVIERGGSIFSILFLAAFGFVLGMFVFSRMSVVDWNEEESVIQTQRMDALGFTVVALYIIFEIGLRVFLRDFFAASASVFILAGVSGTLLGRAIGMVVEIHHVYRQNHPAI